MKKFLCTFVAILAVVLTFALAGCSDGKSSDSKFVGEWECVSLTEFADDEQYTYPVDAEVCILVVKDDGTFKATSTYRGTVYDIVEGNWVQNGDSVTVSNVHFGEGVADDEDSRLTVIFTDNDHLTLKIEVEIEIENSNEGSSYNLQRK